MQNSYKFQKLLFFVALVLLLVSAATVFGQDSAPRRRSGVKIAPTPVPESRSARRQKTEDDPVTVSDASGDENSLPDENTDEGAESKTKADKKKRDAAARKQASDEKAASDARAAEEKKRLREQQDLMAAGAAALERERENAARAATVEAARRNAELQREVEEMRSKSEKELAEKNRLEKENRERSEAAAKEAVMAQNRIKAVEAQSAMLRAKLIRQTAINLKFLNPDDALPLVPAAASTETEIDAALRAEVRKNPRLARLPSFCDADFAGEPFTYSQTAELTLDDLLLELHSRFNLNFLPDAELANLPVKVNVINVPWNQVLRSQLSYLDIEPQCAGGNTIQLVKRTKLATIQDNIRKTAPTRTEYIKLKYLRPVVGGQSNLAGKATGTASIESLEQTIQKILSTGGDARGSISRIPGRAEFFITATDEQLAQIQQVISKADRPTYRVDVFGLVYTVNENKLRDVGSQLSAVLGSNSGFSTLPQTTTQNSGTGSTGTTGSSTAATGSPKGLPGFAQPGGLGAGSPNSILGARVQIGLLDFNYQLSLLEQLGVARRVEKPFVSAKDGTTGTFENGTQIPVVIQAANNLGGGASGTIDFINAGTTLSATPQVVEGEDGLPKLVNLTLRLESNTPDLSIQTTGNVPSVNSRRIQNEITIAPEQAFIFGGSNDISETDTVSRTPVLGELPVVGNLFKRKNKAKTDNKLYFAVWVRISLDDGTSPVPTNNLNTNFPDPPSMNQPLALPAKKP